MIMGDLSTFWGIGSFPFNHSPIAPIVWGYTNPSMGKMILFFPVTNNHTVWRTLKSFILLVGRCAWMDHWDPGYLLFLSFTLFYGIVVLLLSFYLIFSPQFKITETTEQGLETPKLWTKEYLFSYVSFFSQIYWEKNDSHKI